MVSELALHSAFSHSTQLPSSFLSQGLGVQSGAHNPTVCLQIPKDPPAYLCLAAPVPMTPLEQHLSGILVCGWGAKEGGPHWSLCSHLSVTAPNTLCFHPHHTQLALAGKLQATLHTADGAFCGL